MVHAIMEAAVVAAVAAEMDVLSRQIERPRDRETETFFVSWKEDAGRSTAMADVAAAAKSMYVVTAAPPVLTFKSHCCRECSAIASSGDNTILPVLKRHACAASIATCEKG